MQPNARVSALALSQTLALDARAKALAASGRDVVNLSVGEPDCDAPAVVRAAARAAVDGGDVRYTPAAGRLSLRKAIARQLSDTRGVAFSAEEITVCHSAKHALSGSLLSLIEPGDEVLLLLPAWVSYVEQIRFAGGIPVGVAPRSDMGPDFDALARAITPRTRGVMINSPSNPSGYVMTADEVRALGELAVERDLWIVSDEIYGRLVFDGVALASPVQVDDEVRARTVIIDGASKSFAMTGYRIGFLAAPPPIAAAVTRLHSQLTGSPNAISQDAYQAALEREPEEVAQQVAHYAQRRALVLDGLTRMGLETPAPGGAYYAFPRVAPWLDERGSEGFCEDLLEQEGLAIVPGTAFGLEGHVRVGYASSMERIEEGLVRLARFLATKTPEAIP